MFIRDVVLNQSIVKSRVTARPASYRVVIIAPTLSGVRSGGRALRSVYKGDMRTRRSYDRSSGSRQFFYLSDTVL